MLLFAYVAWLRSLFEAGSRTLFANEVRRPNLATTSVVAIVGVSGHRVTEENSLILLPRIYQVGLENVTNPRKYVTDNVSHFYCSSGMQIAGLRS